jgi:thiazole synthase ThiGH ThiG subunit
MTDQQKIASDHADDSSPGDSWEVAGHRFTSRLIVGTGKYKDFAQNAAAVEASGAQIVTVAVRRVNISDPGQPVLMDYIDPLPGASPPKMRSAPCGWRARRAAGSW